MKVDESSIRSKLKPSLSNSEITSITPIEVISTGHDAQLNPISQNGTFHFPTNTITAKSTNEPIQNETIVIDNDDPEPPSGQDAIIIPETESNEDTSNKGIPSDIKIEPLEAIDPKKELEKDEWKAVDDDDADSGPEIVEMIESRDDSDGDGFHLSNDVPGK